MRSPAPRTWPFFVLALGFTWGLQLPAVLAARGLLPGDPGAYLPFAGLGLLGPLVAATVLSWRSGGPSAVRQLFSPLLRFRVHPLWYVAALLPAVLLTGILVLFQLAGREGPIAYLPSLGGVLVGVVISVVEEVGWRGYAQPRLSARFGPLGAAMIVGVVWYVWHLPMFAGQGVPIDLWLVMLLFFVGASLLMAWLSAGTGGSLVLAVVAHLGAHLNNSHRALPGDVVPCLVHAILLASLGLFLMRSQYVPAARRAATRL